MTSHRYIRISRGHVSIHGKQVGGAIPQLLSHIRKHPERRGGEISSNQIVGIITPPQAAPVLQGGQLLKHIHFGHAPKKDEARIKFIF